VNDLLKNKIKENLDDIGNILLEKSQSKKTKKSKII